MVAKRLGPAAFLLLLWGALFPSAPASAAPGEIYRVSVRSNGTEGNDDSHFPRISSDGRYVCFFSFATNLVSGDTNGISDIFRHDVATGKTIRVSVSHTERQLTGEELHQPVLCDISGNGAMVVFDTALTGLESKDAREDDGFDVFLRHVSGGATLLVNITSAGKHVPSFVSTQPTISDSGQQVAFQASGTLTLDGGIYVRNRQANTLKNTSVNNRGGAGNDYSYSPQISPNGRFVVFASDATNLVPRDTNGTRDVFLRDLSAGKTTRINVSSDGTQAAADPDSEYWGGMSDSPDITADGRFVVFDSDSSNLVPGDTNKSADIFLRDRQSNTTERISVAPGGGQADSGSFRPSISNDGRFIAFTSEATNLVVGDTNSALDIFVYDRVTRTSIRVSETADGGQADRDSSGPRISANGEWVVFNSDATNLVAGDTNGKQDLFVKRIVAPDN